MVLKHEKFSAPIVPIMIKTYIFDPPYCLTRSKKSLLCNEFYLWNYARTLHSNFSWIFYVIDIEPISLSEKASCMPGLINFYEWFYIQNLGMSMLYFGLVSLLARMNNLFCLFVSFHFWLINFSHTHAFYQPYVGPVKQDVFNHTRDY